MPSEKTPVHDGGPAFPVSHYVNVDGETFQSRPTGMTLRDWFAGQALAGMSATHTRGGWLATSIVEACYVLADEMLKQGQGDRG